MAEKIRISFTLEESDLAYFRRLFRSVRRGAAGQDPKPVLHAVAGLIERVRAARRVPSIVKEAVRTLEDLVQMLDDKDYAVPKRVATDVLAALTYFANPADLIPDQIPGLGFLDDAIMIKLLEQEFRHELWAYRKFRSFRENAEQRPWTAVARARLPRRLEEYRKKLRAEVERRRREQTERRWLSW